MVMEVIQKLRARLTTGQAFEIKTFSVSALRPILEIVIQGSGNDH